jgi:hypothetical protein
MGRDCGVGYISKPTISAPLPFHRPPKPQMTSTDRIPNPRPKNDRLVARDISSPCQLDWVLPESIWTAPRARASRYPVRLVASQQALIRPETSDEMSTEYLHCTTQHRSQVPHPPLPQRSLEKHRHWRHTHARARTNLVRQTLLSCVHRTQHHIHKL